MTKEELVKKMNTYFNLSEIEMLCFNMGINDENIPGRTLEGKIKNLVQYCERSNRFEELINRLESERRHVDWSVPIKSLKPNKHEMVETLYAMISMIEREPLLVGDKYLAMDTNFNVGWLLVDGGICPISLYALWETLKNAEML